MTGDPWGTGAPLNAAERKAFGPVEGTTCDGGRCGPIVAGDEDDYDGAVPEFLPGMEIPPHQYGYCHRCRAAYRWDVPQQRWVPLAGVATL